MSTQKEISKKLNALIEKNNDAYKGFKNASENADSSPLKSYLLEQASQRKSFAHKLSGNLKAYDPEFDVDTDGSVTGSLHRTWMDIKATMSADTDESILEECIRGDKASVEEYEDFLKNNATIATDIRTTVQDELQNIKTTLNRVKSLEDIH